MPDPITNLATSAPVAAPSTASDSSAAWLAQEHPEWNQQPASAQQAAAMNAAYLAGQTTVLPRMGTPSGGGNQNELIRIYDTTGLSDPRNQPGVARDVTRAEYIQMFGRTPEQSEAAKYQEFNAPINFAAYANVPLSSLPANVASRVQDYYVSHPSAAYQEQVAKYAANIGTVATGGRGEGYVQGSFVPTVAAGAGGFTGRAAEYKESWTPLTHSALYGQEPTVERTSIVAPPDMKSITIAPGREVYVPIGEMEQQLRSDAKLIVSATGAYEVWQTPKSTLPGSDFVRIYPMITAGGSDYALQSGMISGKAQTPWVVSEFGLQPLWKPSEASRVAEIQANPEQFSRLGSELYGGIVQKLLPEPYNTIELAWGRGQTVEPGVYPAVRENYASLVNFADVNAPKGTVSSAADLPKFGAFSPEEYASMPNIQRVAVGGELSPAMSADLLPQPFRSTSTAPVAGTASTVPAPYVSVSEPAARAAVTNPVTGAIQDPLGWAAGAAGLMGRMATVPFRESYMPLTLGLIAPGGAEFRVEEVGASQALPAIERIALGPSGQVATREANPAITAVSGMGQEVPGAVTKTYEGLRGIFGQLVPGASEPAVIATRAERAASTPVSELYGQSVPGAASEETARVLGASGGKLYDVGAGAAFLASVPVSAWQKAGEIGADIYGTDAGAAAGIGKAYTDLETSRWSAPETSVPVPGTNFVYRTDPAAVAMEGSLFFGDTLLFGVATPGKDLLKSQGQGQGGDYGAFSAWNVGAGQEIQRALGQTPATAEQFTALEQATAFKEAGPIAQFGEGAYKVIATNPMALPAAALQGVEIYATLGLADVGLAAIGARGAAMGGTTGGILETIGTGGRTIFNSPVVQYGAGLGLVGLSAYQTTEGFTLPAEQAYSRLGSLGINLAAMGWGGLAPEGAAFVSRGIGIPNFGIADIMAGRGGGVTYPRGGPDITPGGGPELPPTGGPSAPSSPSFPSPPGGTIGRGPVGEGPVGGGPSPAGGGGGYSFTDTTNPAGRFSRVYNTELEDWIRAPAPSAPETPFSQIGGTPQKMITEGDLALGPYSPFPREAPGIGTVSEPTFVRDLGASPIPSDATAMERIQYALRYNPPEKTIAAMEYIRGRYPRQEAIWERYATDIQQVPPERAGPEPQLQPQPETIDLRPEIDLRPYAEAPRASLNIPTEAEIAARATPTIDLSMVPAKFENPSVYVDRYATPMERQMIFTQYEFTPEEIAFAKLNKSSLNDILARRESMAQPEQMIRTTSTLEPDWMIRTTRTPSAVPAEDVFSPYSREDYLMGYSREAEVFGTTPATGTVPGTVIVPGSIGRNIPAEDYSRVFQTAGITPPDIIGKTVPAEDYARTFGTIGGGIIFGTTPATTTTPGEDYGRTFDQITRGGLYNPPAGGGGGGDGGGGGWWIRGSETPPPPPPPPPPVLPLGGGIGGQGGGGGKRSGYRRYLEYFPVGLDISMFGTQRGANPFTSGLGRLKYLPRDVGLVSTPGVARERTVRLAAMKAIPVKGKGRNIFIQ